MRAVQTVIGLLTQDPICEREAGAPVTRLAIDDGGPRPLEVTCRGSMAIETAFLMDSDLVEVSLAGRECVAITLLLTHEGAIDGFSTGDVVAR